MPLTVRFAIVRPEFDRRNAISATPITCCGNDMGCIRANLNRSYDADETLIPIL